ncbi:hypothetical protein PAECIP111893_01850 [Paenibacillus plantiphilus]|uniref:Endonuclease GajA/Old nuclease/RecF-like AAA domain-containing protein n=1 Tax=Paenibacillus plantiphilus TaxID=2905650 RepID=A0ABN8G869_9BACL|nr:AAA family ATPase [Paenibacillus plantiphilus]CAH1202612.1 hypothetical protein PAECIP111893_01850 [Paenibacillus plantiphilus]
MNPQLLYVYIKDIGRCFYNQEFSFTNDFDIQFGQERRLLISRKPNPYKKLWGSNISNVNLIVGKNGAGKTTLFDLLGSTNHRRKNLFKKPLRSKLDEFKEEWFAVYHIANDLFVIEGYNPALISNISEIPYGTSYEYSIGATYSFEEQHAQYDDYIQSMSMDGDENTLNRNMLSLYFANDNTKDWFSGNAIRDDEQDYYVGFQRLYSNKPRYANIYKFISREYKMLEKDHTSRHAICVLEREDHIYPGMVTKAEALERFELYLYQDKSQILYYQTEASIILYGSDGNRKRPGSPDRWTTKEKFIITYVEAFIIDLWMNRTDALLEEGAKAECSAAIAALEINANHFQERIGYLLHVLQLINAAADPKLHAGRLRLDAELLTIVVEAFTETADHYFTSSTKMTLHLNEDFDNGIHKLFELFDAYIPRSHAINHSIRITFRHLSSGELAFINGFSNLYTAIDIAQNNKEIKTILILLDEPDASFHPEWSRRYIHNLSKFLNAIDFGRELAYQIVIATHSPFIVSDVPSEHITCIRLHGVVGGIQRIAAKAEFGLMSNFYDIIQNDFFIHSPIGEHAKSIFEDIIKRIGKLREFDKEEIDGLQQLISAIGEPLIRGKLQQMLTDRTTKLFPELERFRRISELERELSQLKKEQRGDNDD